MKRSKRLQAIRSIAEHEELEERKSMASCQSFLEDARRRLHELESYRNVYARQKRPGSGAGPQQWQDYQRFMQRLDTALAEQQKVIADCAVQREAHRQRWIAKRQRLQSLSRAVDRFRTEETEAEERRLQKQQDAMAQRYGRTR